MGVKVQVDVVYEVVAHRESTSDSGDWWVFEVPAVGAVGQVRQLSEVAGEARAILAAWDDGGPSEDQVSVRVRLDGEGQARRLWSVGEDRERVGRVALEEAAVARREAVALLRDVRGYSAMDTARVLGVSRQRVYQLGR